ncbi:glycoside hydrolase family 2 TIM barrel-domain containing protein [Paenibacillus sp. LHD-117]|uniref:glycoside hydrolase family 2 TIM barrel-domain containing protein n=1 Tax=Paenibacillus sp. LHD-117 TaxID=3071412 RepID=UPI0027E169F9|nr:glycoside hydrolase family 2 TIM barrel-domain containing protein [Paenibacillus sp. LHD-117]MDQ6419561.1 glycoside hydrolase family 2 TIM barrel-domain containing protein [Paenibacillus sp. LHD-117]
MNAKTLFNDGWEFAKSGLDAADCEGLSFEPVDLPHDWLIYNTLALYENSIGWYRKKFVYTKGSGKGAVRLFLYFDGVYMDSSVYVNGSFVGEWKYGYSSFEHDMTDALADGENEILVKVVHQSPNSRWYSGAGIYRNVWLRTIGADYIETDGIYVSTRQEGDAWTVEIETKAHMEQDAIVEHRIFYRGQLISECSERAAAGGTVRHNRQTLSVDRPLLWSPDEPNLYKLVTSLRRAAGPEQPGEELETIARHLGFRSIEMDPERGLRVNGERLKLNGVCEHHDLGALGAAFNKQALRRRFVILKEMGVNAVRTAHNMPAPELMDLADEMGLFVVSEAFDMWERPKTPYDYARFFGEWACRDVKSWVLRDRNHPSLLMWSIGNEIYDTHADERGQEVTRMLMDYVLEFDPKQNAKVTIGSNYMPWENARKCADIVKLAGYNYAEKYYDKHHEEHPDWIIYGSETASVVQSRGIYRFPFDKSILADDDEQCSALGNSSTSWGAKSAEACIIAERDTPFSLGQFLWTGFDYIGEPTPYHTKNSYFGQIDTATFKKDSYYVYQAAWTDYRTHPMVHVFPYWDFNDGQTIDVRVCSNAPRIELLLGGVSVGIMDIDHERGKQLVGWWKLPYAPGEIQAIAYDEAGNAIATGARSSFGDAAAIRLEADKAMLAADGEDLIFLEIGMLDVDGHPVDNANNRVRVEVTGEGRLLGLDNGDSTDFDPYKGTSRRLFSGKLMAIIGSTLQPGRVKVIVHSEGMQSETVEFVSGAVESGASSSVSAASRNKDLPCITGASNEIPLRKIEIISDEGQRFDENKQEMAVRARLWPANTSYPDVEWRVVTDEGIDSNIAKVEADGLTAKVTAIGDGSFRLRCTSRNGTDKTKLISQLEFTSTGLGTAYKDPYGFISAGLYDYGKGEVGNGNERGVATSRDGETQVGFRDIDFGPYGSDSITIPIFALSSESYELQIWEGMPDEEGSEMVADVVYQKPSRWNVYQEETYRLSKRLKGIASICFVLRQKVHIKGFSFERQSRAFERNAAASSDRIYGDAFTVAGTSVEGIGNNVSLEFAQMDFTAEGTAKLIVNGRSPIDKNTIHIRFAGESGESSQLVEFGYTEGYEEREFELERVSGKQNVTFIFLPGSRFDFGWFRFERG